MEKWIMEELTDLKTKKNADSELNKQTLKNKCLITNSHISSSIPFILL